MAGHTCHEIKVTATCPVDPTVTDEYDVYVYPPRGTTVFAEAVTKAVDALTRRPVTQEDLTQFLANVLRSSVQSVGNHAGGRVRTVCDRDPQEPMYVRPEDVRL